MEMFIKQKQEKAFKKVFAAQNTKQLN